MPPPCVDEQNGNVRPEIHESPLLMLKRRSSSWSGTVERTLRLKSHMIRQPLTAKEMGKRNMLSRLGDFAETVLQVSEFGWKAGWA